MNISLLLGNPINKGVVAVDKETSARSSRDSVTSVVTTNIVTNNESSYSRLGYVRRSFRVGITIHSLGLILALELFSIEVRNRRIKHHLSIMMLL